MVFAFPGGASKIATQSYLINDINPRPGSIDELELLRQAPEEANIKSLLQLAYSERRCRQDLCLYP